MSLRDQIQADMKAAMKSQEKQTLEVLRYMWSEISNAEIDAKEKLDDDTVVKLLSKEVKKRKEAIEQFEKGGRDELVVEEQAKLAVIEDYLPEQMGKEEIGVVVDDVMSQGMDDFGAVMGAVMQRVGSQADGTLVSEVVREKLAE